MRRDTSSLTADQIEVNFAAGPGRQPAHLSADLGRGNASDRWFELEGAIRIRQGDDLIATERARYDGRDGLVRGDAPVTLTGPGYRLDGPGFTLDPEGRTVRVDGGASLRAEGARR
jgi:hypothetical protein